MYFLKKIQTSIEEAYGVNTGLDVREFVRVQENFARLGSLVVKTLPNSDLDLALLLDRDIYSAWASSAGEAPFHSRKVSVPFEEVSHFVYLSYNHFRQRNVTYLEMEIQSEIDRIFLTFHGPYGVSDAQKKELLEELKHKEYSIERYEESRKIAVQFLFQMGADPSAWTEDDFKKLRQFFHSDLSEKIHLSRS